MSDAAWDAIQTRTVDSIEAEVFDVMGNVSDSDPRSRWADLALALCQRIRAAEKPGTPDRRAGDAQPGEQSMTAQEALVEWDAGRPVASIEMGGIGPGYEQAIQILVWELVRDAEPVHEEMSLRNWGEAAVARCDKTVGGFSGAQVGAAKGLAARFLLGQYEHLLSKNEDRRILVSRAFPACPPPPSASPDRKEPKP